VRNALSAQNIPHYPPLRVCGRRSNALSRCGTHCPLKTFRTTHRYACADDEVDALSRCGTRCPLKTFRTTHRYACADDRFRSWKPPSQGYGAPKAITIQCTRSLVRAYQQLEPGIAIRSSRGVVLMVRRTHREGARTRAPQKRTAQKPASLPQRIATRCSQRIYTNRFYTSKVATSSVDMHVTTCP
jgi:hypothetical protein